MSNYVRRSRLGALAALTRILAVLLPLWSALANGAVPRLDLVRAARWLPKGPGTVYDVQVVGDQAFLACAEGLYIVDLKYPAATLIGHRALGFDYGSALAVADGYVYLSNGYALLVI